MAQPHEVTAIDVALRASCCRSSKATSTAAGSRPAAIYFDSDPFLGRGDGCQPPTRFSNDPARIVRLEPARIGGVDGSRGGRRLVVSS